MKNNTLVSVYPQLHVESDIDSSHFAYMALSGTSTSAGVVSGTVALMLQANPSLTPNRVKAIHQSRVGQLGPEQLRRVDQHLGIIV